MNYSIYGGKNPQNIMRGMQSRAQGEIFEKFIMASCDYYRDAGIAHIEKTPEPFHVTRSCGNGRFLGNFAKQAQPDFKGCLWSGKAVVFEAKHTDADRITQDRVTQEQTDALNRYCYMGAICFILVSFGMQQFYRIPWSDWRDMKLNYGRKYIMPEDVQDYQCHFDGRVIYFLGKEDVNEPQEQATQMAIQMATQND